MITPATTGRTKSEGGGGDAQMGAERRRTAHRARPTEDDSHHRADQMSAHLPIVVRIRRRRSVTEGTVQDLFRPTAHGEEPVQNDRRNTRSMEDFLVVLGIIGFALVDARPDLGAGAGMTVDPGHSARRRRPDVHLPRRRHVQAGVVLDGLLLDHRHPGRRPGAHLALPRLLHGRRLRRPGPLPPVGRAPRLPAARHQPGAGADLEALRRLDGHLLGGLDRLHLPDHPHPGVAPAQPAAPGGGAAGAQLQHRRRRSSPTPTGRTTAARRPCRTSPRWAP